MFHRRGRRPLPRVQFHTESAEEETARLLRMVSDLNEVIEMLWLEVEGLRAQLAAVRGVDDVAATYAAPPTQGGDGEVAYGVASLTLLRAYVDRTNLAADALWFEAQWMRSQLAAAQEGPLGTTQ